MDLPKKNKKWLLFSWAQLWVLLVAALLAGLQYQAYKYSGNTYNLITAAVSIAVVWGIVLWVQIRSKSWQNQRETQPVATDGN